MPSDHGPVELHVVKAINALGRAVKEFVDGELPGHGFIILIAKHGEGGRTNYLSSLERASAIELLGEFLGKMKADEAAFRKPRT